jgi:hypothetical protein
MQRPLQLCGCETIIVDLADTEILGKSLRLAYFELKFLTTKP